MATFRYYNIQLLPLDTSTTRMVGVAGYRKLFEALKTEASAAIRDRVLDSVAYPLRNEMLFGPYFISIEEKYAHGQFVKFDVAQEVKNLYTNETEFEGGPGSTAHPFHFRFVFDFEKHILAIEDTKGRLPAPSQLINAFYYLLKDIVHEGFRNHRLDVQQLSSDEALEEVIRSAVGYQKLEVELTFSNSDETLDEYLQELIDNNVHHVQHIENAAKDHYMHKPTSGGLVMLEAAKKFGNATIRYVEQIGENLRRRTYRMRDCPVRITIGEPAGISQEETLLRIRDSIQAADERSRRKLPRQKNIKALEDYDVIE